MAFVALFSGIKNQEILGIEIDMPEYCIVNCGLRNEDIAFALSTIPQDITWKTFRVFHTKIPITKITCGQVDSLILKQPIDDFNEIKSGNVESLA